MKKNSLIFLVGYMGAGKSTVGKMLSESLKFSFIDLDTAIQTETRKNISTIFEEEGELEFRKIEQRILYSLGSKKNCVIATGGGCPQFENNMEWMNNNGITVYLKVHPGTIFHRIAPEKTTRPLIAAISDIELMEYILETLKKRLLFYIKAKHTVSGEDSVKVVARNIQISLQE